MGVTRNATKAERFKLMLYKYSLWIILAVSVLISVLLNVLGLMKVIEQNAVTLAVTGVAVAAFLFTAQSILTSVSTKNEFIREVKRDGNYFPYIHRFCRRAEITFVGNWIPMLYMGNTIYSLAVTALFLFAVLFTLWAMWLIGQILIYSEKH